MMIAFKGIRGLNYWIIDVCGKSTSPKTSRSLKFHCAYEIKYLQKNKKLFYICSVCTVIECINICLDILKSIAKVRILSYQDPWEFYSFTIINEMFIFFVVVEKNGRRSYQNVYLSLIMKLGITTKCKLFNVRK